MTTWIYIYIQTTYVHTHAQHTLYQMSICTFSWLVVWVHLYFVFWGFKSALSMVLPHTLHMKCHFSIDSNTSHMLTALDAWYLQFCSCFLSFIPNCHWLTKFVPCVILYHYCFSDHNVFPFPLQREITNFCCS